MNITLYIGPSGVEKAAKSGAKLIDDEQNATNTKILSIPLLSGPVEFKKRNRSFVWTGNIDGAKSIAIVDWLHGHKIGFTYDCSRG